MVSGKLKYLGSYSSKWVIDLHHDDKDAGKDLWGGSVDN